MKLRMLALAMLTIAALGACDKPAANIPPPHTLTADAVDKYCGMLVVEHEGPKGQIILASQADPVWFASVRDTVAFTLLPEEAKDIRAIYVSDMAKATNWAEPGIDNWVEARSAVFVIGSTMRGGMGTEETVPFSDRAAAERFIAAHGGRVVAFAEIPHDYVLGSGEAGHHPADGDTPGTAAAKAHDGPAHDDHGH